MFAFRNIDVHHVFFLLKNSFSLPKLLYTLRTSPCFKRQDLLAEYDDTLYSGLEKTCNVCLESTARLQAFLPPKMAGLGLGSAVRLTVSGYYDSGLGLGSAVRLGVSGYLASVSSCQSLCNGILGHEFVER